MPTYEYQCKKCGYTFEKFQSITAKPLENCPVCNGPVYRLISKNGSLAITVLIIEEAGCLKKQKPNLIKQ